MFNRKTTVISTITLLLTQGCEARQLKEMVINNDYEAILMSRLRKMAHHKLQDGPRVKRAVVVPKRLRAAPKIVQKQEEEKVTRESFEEPTLLAAAKKEEIQEEREIYWGTPEAKKARSYRGKHIETQEQCDSLNRSWNKRQERCMRVCKFPRNDYRFDRRRYRCFIKKSAAIKRQKHVCPQGVWDSTVSKCVTKSENQLQKHQASKKRLVSERCQEGKFYGPIKNTECKGPQCNKCYSIKESKCAALGRDWKADSSLCKASESRRCTLLKSNIDRLVKNVASRCKSKRCQTHIGKISKYIQKKRDGYKTKCMVECGTCKETCKLSGQNIFDAQGKCRKATRAEKLIPDELKPIIERNLV